MDENPNNFIEILKNENYAVVVKVIRENIALTLGL